MRRHLGIILLAVVAVAALLITIVAFTVDTTEIVLVKTFGKTTRVYYGSRPVERDAAQAGAAGLERSRALAQTRDAGLHFRWPYPIQSLVRYDARSFVFEDTLDEAETRDKYQILLTMYCSWRIDDPVKFDTSVGTIDAAEQSIRSLLRSKKEDVIGQHPFSDFVNTEPEGMKLETISREILVPLREQAGDLYGVEIQAVGIKSLNIPEGATAEVINTMREERMEAASTIRQQGEARATAIRERARSARDQIVAFARRKAEDIRTQGDRAAAEYYKEFAKNPQLSAFLRYLSSLREELKQRTVILLDGTMLPSMRFFREPPTTGSLVLPGPLGETESPPAGGEAESSEEESRP